MSRPRLANGGGAAAKRTKLPLIRCKGLRVVAVGGAVAWREVVVGVFIEKLTDLELICFSEANGYGLPPGGANSERVKETHTGLIPLSQLSPPPIPPP